MKEVLTFLQENPIYYLATVEDDQPRVRPFGATAEYNGNLYFCTNNTKKVYNQMKANPKVEISTFSAKDGKWIRLSGKAVFDESKEAKEAMLEANPSLKSMYSLEDGIYTVFYLEDMNYNIYSF